MVWNNMIPKKGVSYEKESNTDFIHCIVHGAVVREALSRQMQQRNHRIQVHIRQYLMQNIIIIPTRIFRRRLDMMHRSCSIILYLPAFMREDQAALISMLQFTEPITRIFRQHSAMTLHPTVPIMRQTVQQRKKCNDTDLGWEGAQAAIVRGSCTTKV